MDVIGRRRCSPSPYLVMVFKEKDCYNADMKMDEERLREIEKLYRQAFAEYGPVALWNMRPVEIPTPGAALAITPALRQYSMDGRRLAERIERLCRAPE